MILHYIALSCTIDPTVGRVNIPPYVPKVDCVNTSYSHRGDTDPEKLLEDPVVGDVAKKHRRSPAQVRLDSSVETHI